MSSTYRKINLYVLNLISGTKKGSDKMKYEIVEINRKTIVGFKSRIKDDETMPKKNFRFTLRSSMKCFLYLI